MNSVKDIFEQQKFSMIKLMCKAEKEGFYLDTCENRYFCVNCGEECPKEDCIVCKRTEYTLPNNEISRQLRDLQRQSDHLLILIDDFVQNEIRYDRNNS